MMANTNLAALQGQPGTPQGWDAAGAPKAQGFPAGTACGGEAAPEPLAAGLGLVQPGGWLRFHQGWLDAGQLLRNLETAVSLLQQAEADVLRVHQLVSRGLEWLREHWGGAAHAARPPACLDAHMQSLVQQVDEAARGSRFHGRGLLNGQSSVVGLGHGVRFLRGGPASQPSPPGGFEVRVESPPSRSLLLGQAPLHPAWLRAEREVLLVEGENRLQLPLGREESAEGFVLRLQRELWAAGLNLEAQLTPGGRLALRHTQYGSQFVFRGLSRRTPILSRQPGLLETCLKGRDIQGELGGEPAFGLGRMLVGLVDNRRTAELALNWAGGRQLRQGQGRCQVLQNSITVQEAPDPGLPPARITLPICTAAGLGRWVDSPSGFRSLADLHCQSWTEARDTLQMLHSVSYELEDWLEKIRQGRQERQDKAFAQLGQAHVPGPAGRQAAALAEAQALQRFQREAQAMASVLSLRVGGA